jgi:hypothetical protein
VLGRTLAASILIAAFGPMTLSEVGTSFADILTALPVIGAVGLILSANAQHPGRHAMAGLLMGAAVGLKLTNMIFLIGAGASLLYAARPAMALAYFAVGSAIGALGTGGAWCWTLWEQFGNPVFPFYNTIFRSPEAPVAPIADGRFMPLNFWDAAAYPFYWLIGDHRSSEGPFRDPRFAILVVLSAAAAAASLIRSKRVFTLRDKQFLLFFSVAYVVWLLAFSIHRYAIALELLAAPMAVLLASRFLRVLPFAAAKTQRVSWTNLAASTAALAIVLWPYPGDWLRRPWSTPYRPVVSGSLLSPATYFLIEKPVGYVIPLLPVGSRAYQLADILLPIAPGARWTAAFVPVSPIRCPGGFGRCIFAAAHRGKVCWTITACGSIPRGRARPFRERIASISKHAPLSHPGKRRSCPSHPIWIELFRRGGTPGVAGREFHRRRSPPNRSRNRRLSVAICRRHAPSVHFAYSSGSTVCPMLRTICARAGTSACRNSWAVSPRWSRP